MKDKPAARRPPAGLGIDDPDPPGCWSVCGHGQQHVQGCHVAQRAVAPIHSLLRQVAVRQVLRKRARYEEESDQQDPRPAVQCHGSKRNGQGVQSAQVASLTVRARCLRGYAGTEVGNSACAGTMHQKNGGICFNKAMGRNERCGMHGLAVRTQAVQ